MTIQEAKKELVDYFDLDLNSHSSKKIDTILASVERVVEKLVIKKKYLYVDVAHSDGPPDLESEAKRISEMYDTTVENMRSKNREHNTVGARAHLVREMRINKRVPVKTLGKFLNRDHSSIIHLAYDAKSTCKMKPLYRMQKTVI
jgi:chromosomal replication initiation ATPase DnaA